MWKRNVGIGLMTATMLAGIAALCLWMISFVFGSLASVGGSFGIAGNTISFAGYDFALMERVAQYLGIGFVIGLLVLMPVGAVLVARNSVSFSVKDAFAFAWKSFKARAGLWIGVTLFIFACSIVSSLAGTFLTFAANSLAILWFVKIAQFFISMALGFMQVRFALQFARGNEVHFGTLFDGFNKFLLFIAVSLILPLGVGIVFAALVAGVLFGGMLMNPVSLILLALFCAGSVYVTLMYRFAPFLAIDKNTGFVASFSESARITKNAKADVFGLQLMCGGLSFLGLVTLGFGFLVVIPVAVLAISHAYVQLEK